MRVLTRARNLRTRLFLKGSVQLMAAAGLTLASLFAGAENGAISLVVCLALAGLFGFFAIRTFQLCRSFKPQAVAERIMRRLVPDFLKKDWQVARQRNLPVECRDYVVLFPPSGEIGFVVGLSGDWPDRGALEGPQAVATELSSYGRPHVPVCLAAFVTGYGDEYPLGVLAATPARLFDALVETEQAFYEEREAALERLRLAHLPQQVTAGTVPLEETFAEPADDFDRDPFEQEAI